MKGTKIDFHTHILPENIPHFHEKFGYKGFIQLAECDEANKKDMVKDTG